jgi:hypothetical protein
VSEWQEMEPHPSWDSDQIRRWKESHRKSEKLGELRATIAQLAEQIEELSQWSYVNVVGDECKGWLNLFFAGEVIALVRDVDLADRIRSVTTLLPRQQKESK